MAMSLDWPGKEGRIVNLRPLCENLAKMGPVDPEKIRLKGITEKKINAIKTYSPVWGMHDTRAKISWRQVYHRRVHHIQVPSRPLLRL